MLIKIWDGLWLQPEQVRSVQVRECSRYGDKIEVRTLNGVKYLRVQDDAEVMAEEIVNKINRKATNR